MIYGAQKYTLLFKFKNYLSNIIHTPYFYCSAHGSYNINFIKFGQNFAVLHAQNITKSYGSLPVLKGVSLTVNKGEVVSIVGPSGAGKTTLLQILGTLDHPDSGTVTIHNTELTKLADKALSSLRNQHLGFVFQAHQLLNEFSALENVMMPALIQGVSKAEASKKAMELLKYLNMQHRADHKPQSMSGGECQRVAMARALVNAPDLVFADEPTGNLDSANSNELTDLIFKLRNERNQTFVLVTHSNEVAAKSDRVIHLQDGLIAD